MDSVSARTSIEDYGSSYGSNTMIEAKVHDVMSIEMSHHQMGGSYLDPRSFGSNNSYDDYQGSYINEEQGNMGTTNGVRQTPYQQVTAVSMGMNRQDNNNYRYDNNVQQQYQQRPVVTYPVKTSTISTCKQYTTPPRAIIALKTAPRRSHSRNTQRKEQLDPKRVEDEVARNVSQILSATKQQKLQQEAQQRSGIAPAGPRLSYNCPECGRNMTSFRNLQRHRQYSCVNSKKPETPEAVTAVLMERSTGSSIISTIAPEDPGIAGIEPSFCSPNMPFSMNEPCDWYSADSFPSAISRDRSESGDMHMDSSTSSSQIPESNCGLPMIDYEDSQNLSSSASHCSSGSTGASTPAAIFTCDSCKKSVCSHRSLKRHHTTCKQYIAEYGLPPEAEALSTVNSPVSSYNLLTFPSLGAVSSLLDESCSLVSSSDDIVSESSRRLPKFATNNTCPDCNRQLCSSSNLKRHRATCKAASGGGVGTPIGEQKYSPMSPAEDAVQRSRVTSFASEGSMSMDQSSSATMERQYIQGFTNISQNQNNGNNNVPQRRPPPPTVYITVTEPIRTVDMNITVGEHLRAQHVQQRTAEKGESPSGSEVRASSNQMTTQNRTHIIYTEDLNDGRSQMISQDSRTNSSGMAQTESYITTLPLNSSMSELRPSPRSSSMEFQCPECKKLYSCRKNVKRHRMAVHKMTPEDISRYPGPVACPTAQNISVPELSPCSISCRANGGCTVKQETKSEYSSEGTDCGSGGCQQQQIRYHTQTLNRYEDTSSSWHTPDGDDMSQSSEMARIGAELKRNNDFEYFDAPDEKKPKAELAEADTTFNEDMSCGNGTLTPDSPPPNSDNFFSGLPPLHSWVDSKHLRGYSRSETSSPAFGKLFQCDKCKRFLSSEYSLRRHRHNCQESASALPASPYYAGDSAGALTLNTSTSPFSDSDPMLGHGPSSASRFFEDEWFKREQIPDSTTNHRVDRSSSPFSMLEQTPVLPPLGNLPYTRKRALSGGTTATTETKQQAKHLCQACGKFYSSEWNLERHKRESCPTKGVDNSAPVSDDISVLLGVTRFVISKAALSRASSSFVQLFNTHDPTKGDFRLDVDPGQFQELLDVFNNPGVLNATNVDSVMHLADKLKFNSVFDFCSKFITDELPRTSVMHALRLADRHGLTSIRRKLIDNISIDIFRSLPADYHFKKMDAELKAELMEKWGTLL